jgi:hypothetical protein
LAKDAGADVDMIEASSDVEDIDDTEATDDDDGAEGPALLYRLLMLSS